MEKNKKNVDGSNNTLAHAGINSPIGPSSGIRNTQKASSMRNRTSTLQPQLFEMSVPEEPLLDLSKATANAGDGGWFCSGSVRGGWAGDERVGTGNDRMGFGWRRLFLSPMMLLGVGSARGGWDGNDRVGVGWRGLFLNQTRSPGLRKGRWGWKPNRERLGSSLLFRVHPVGVVTGVPIHLFLLKSTRHAQDPRILHRQTLQVPEFACTRLSALSFSKPGQHTTYPR